MSAGTYPALGFDPAPGDVFQVATLVSTLRSVGAVTGPQRALGGLDQGKVCGVCVADDKAERGIGAPAVEVGGTVDADQVTVAGRAGRGAAHDSNAAVR